jgi:predicted porin
MPLTETTLVPRKFEARSRHPVQLRMSDLMKRQLLCTAACFTIAGQVRADDDSLTYKGVTLYGWVDVNLTYGTHGEKTNSTYPVGVDYLIIGAKNANHSVLGLSENGISGSRIGLKGTESLVGDWSAIFKVESEFNPLSGQLQDGLKSMADQNGVPLAQQRTGWGDSNKAGQLLSGNAWAGVSHPTYGSATAGRQTSMIWDDLMKYDPNYGSLALSLLGYSGGLSGGGDTEDRYLDNTLRYAGHYGIAHGSLQYGFGDGGAEGTSIQIDLGLDVSHFSVDALYSRMKDAVSASPLTTNASGALSASQSAAMSAFGLNETNTLAATITDNSAYVVNAMYDFGRPKILGGYERIIYSNPQSPDSSKGLVDGLGEAQTIGGYYILTSNSALPKDKVLQVAWFGGRYSFSPAWEVDLTYYYEAQNNYSTSAALAGCSNRAISSQCRGNFYGIGMLSEYTLSSHWEFYGGAIWSQVTGGIANGYLQTNDFEPTIGFRVIF